MFSPTTALMLSTKTNIKRFCTTQIKVSLLQYLHQQLKKSKVWENCGLLKCAFRVRELKQSVQLPAVDAVSASLSD